MFKMLNFGSPSYPLQLFSLGLVCPLLSKVLLCIDKAVIDDEVDVGVVGVEELGGVRQLRVVQEQPQVLGGDLLQYLLNNI